jgi:hypothetical protein
VVFITIIPASSFYDGIIRRPIWIFEKLSAIFERSVKTSPTTGILVEVAFSCKLASLNYSATLVATPSPAIDEASSCVKVVTLGMSFSSVVLPITKKTSERRKQAGITPRSM